MNHLQIQKTTKMLHKEQGTFISDGKLQKQHLSKEIWIRNTVKIQIKDTLYFSRFLHPIIYGEYPKSMQNIVRERLPRFTEEEIKIVKGSIDYVGINQYTAYYISNPQLPKQGKPTRYQSDWHAQFWCKLPAPTMGARTTLGMLRLYINLLNLDYIYIIIHWEANYASPLQMSAMAYQLVQE